MIDFGVELIAIGGPRSDAQIIPCLRVSRSEIRRRNQRQRGRSRGIDQARRQGVVRQRRADYPPRGVPPPRSGVENCAVVLGKIAAAERHRRKVRQAGRSRSPAPLPLVVSEEERAILAVVNLGNFQRPSQREPELVLLEWLPADPAGVGEEVVGVELLVAQKLPAAAVQRVRAGLGSGRNDGAGGAPELGAEVVCLDFELLHRIH